MRILVDVMRIAAYVKRLSHELACRTYPSLVILVGVTRLSSGVARFIVNVAWIIAGSERFDCHQRTMVSRETFGYGCVGGFVGSDSPATMCLFSRNCSVLRELPVSPKLGFPELC